jgi:DNA invertase Pin-like site-specific DNA recombinase
MTVKAYSYARFSSRAQAEGDSLRRQLSAAYAYAEANGLELDTTLQDHGVSAFTGDNRTKGALRAFLDRVEHGEIERGSHLLIDSMDRLSRQMVTEATHQLLGIALAGITVVTLSDGRKFDRDASMADVMMAVIEIERSHRESLEKGRKVAEAHANSKHLARAQGRVWHRSGPTWTVFNEATRKFDVIPHKAATVQRVFDLVEAGLGTTAIARQFNGEQVETPRGKIGEWHHSAVLEIAHNRAVIGEYQPKLAKSGNRASRRPADGEPIEGYYPEVISREQFYRVQQIIAARARKRQRGNGKDFANLFVGLCRCNACGGTVGMHTAQKDVKYKRNSVLQCVNARRGLCASKHRFRYKFIEDAVLTLVREFVLPSERKNGHLQGKLAAAQGERDELAGKVDNLLALLEEGDTGILGRYRQRKNELDAKDAEIVELRRMMREKQVLAPPLESRQAAIEKLVQQMQVAEGEELYRIRAAVSASLKGVIGWIEFYGAPDEVFENVTVREHYIEVRLADDDNIIYMIAEDKVERITFGDQLVRERLWTADFLREFELG